MGHCVYLYVNDAIRGKSFLFHTSYKGEMATTEVDSSGRVRQSYGPHNMVNKASRYAERILSEWGKQFPEPPWKRARRVYEENHQNVGLQAIRIDEDGVHAVPYNALPAPAGEVQ